MKKITVGTLIIILVMMLSTGCRQKTYDELVQTATYGGTKKMMKSEETQPSYEPSPLEHGEDIEFTRNDLNQTDAYEDNGESEYESFEDEIE